MNLRLWRRKFPRPGRSAETIKLATRRSRSRRLPRRRLILSGTHWRPSIAEDHATAQRLFEACGRKDVAAAIEDARAALDRKEYATAQRLFEALGQKEPLRAGGDLRRLPSPRHWQGVQWRRPTPGLNRNPRNRCSTLFRLWMQPFAEPYLMQKRQNRDARGLFYSGQGLCYLRSAAHLLLHLRCAA